MLALVSSSTGHSASDSDNSALANGKIVHDLTANEVDRLFKVNISSHFVLIKEFLPGMLAAKKGHIVTIASMASFVAAPGLLDYCCTKVAALYLNDGECI
jgi:all-trans-retinol dehydrogenase (NAD+)